MELSIVIPVHNEAGGVRGVIEEITRVVPQTLAYEIIAVDDGSDDDTAAELQAARIGIPQLRVLHHTRRCGQSAATGSGVRAARAHWVATLDGDGQNDPADIMQLFAAMDSSDDRVMLVVGHRVTRRDSGFKWLASRVANGVRARVLGDGTPDSACGIKLFARQTWLALPQFDHMHRFLPALVQRLGGESLSVPVNHRERSAGKSKYGINDRLWAGVVDLFGVWWLKRRYCTTEITELQ